MTECYMLGDSPGCPFCSVPMKEFGSSWQEGYVVEDGGPFAGSHVILGYGKFDSLVCRPCQAVFPVTRNNDMDTY